MSKALIISVGGSIERIVSSIAEHCPSLVVFFASEQTIESIGTIKARLQEQNIAIDNRNVMTANAEDLEACYTKALECAEIVLDRERPPAQMVVDLTPGTKAMTAALCLWGGLMGRVTFLGNLAPFVPFLQAGEILHAGKGTSFGLGRFRVVSER